MPNLPKVLRKNKPKQTKPNQTKNIAINCKDMSVPPMMIFLQPNIVAIRETLETSFLVHYFSLLSFTKPYFMRYLFDKAH